jgi:hypothetical protein
VTNQSRVDVGGASVAMTAAGGRHCATEARSGIVWWQQEDELVGERRGEIFVMFYSGLDDGICHPNF